MALAAMVSARAQSPPAPTPPPQALPEEAPPGEVPPAGVAAPAPTAQAPDLNAPLEPAERDTLLRLAWRTLVGHLTDRPIKDSDLEAYDLTPRLQGKRGCFVTLQKGGQTRGRQGDIDASRPLYQQAIVFTRRAATRDPRFLPLTDLDLPDVVVEIEVIGERRRVDGPAQIEVARQGVFLEKWGRRALFLPGLASSQGWGAQRTLDELCKQASLPAGAWSQGARIEVFTTEIVAGTQPPPLAAPGPAPALESAPEATPTPAPTSPPATP
jgi:AmmeMemoRadiSam system protein A